MIFDSKNEKVYIENLIQSNFKDSYTKILVHVGYYNQDTDSGLFIPLTEGNINATEFFNAPEIKNKSRYILIGYDGTACHAGTRIKVGRAGERIHPHNMNIISIYYDNNDANYEGKLSNINMTEKEFKWYKEFFLRNINLIRLARNDNLINDVEEALIRVEEYRRAGYQVITDINGNSLVTDKHGKIIHKENLKGIKI